MKSRPPAGLFSFLLLMASCFFPAVALAQDVQVNTADPATAPQGTINLNVTIKGKGFKNGAQAKWFVTGTTNPGGVTVNSTAFVSASELRANITIADDATIADFDIEVTNSNGRSGKGTELFKVTAKGNPNTQPPPNPAIVFGNGVDISVANADGTNVVEIVTSKTKGRVKEFHREPNWSPDATRIVLVSNRDGNFGLWMMNPDGTNFCKIAALTESGFVDPDWSPIAIGGGHWIVYADSSTGSRDLWIVRAACPGGTPINLTSQSGVKEVFFPTWSRLADRLVMQGTSLLHGSGFFLMDITFVGTTPVVSGVTNLTAQGPLNGLLPTFPSWARTHDRILLSADPYNNDVADSDLWLIDPVDPFNPVNLTPNPIVQELMGSWSPDDFRIVFRRHSSDPGEATTVATIGSDGTGLAVWNVVGSRPKWRRCRRSLDNLPEGVPLCGF